MPLLAESQVPQSEGRYFIFDTHPIQYRSPVFRALYQRLPGLKVFFLWNYFDGNQWWFHEVNKVPVQTWGISLDTGFPNELLSQKRLSLLKLGRRLNKILTHERPKAVLLYGYFLPENWLLWGIANAKNIPVLFIGETMERPSTWMRNAIKRVLLPLFFRGISRVVTIGKKSTQFYRSLNIPADKLTEGRYCVDTAFFEMPPADHTTAREKIRTALGIGPKETLILFVGRLYDRKRPHDALTLQQKVAQARSDVHTVIIGHGELEATLREQGKEIPRLHILGFKNQIEIRDYYHAADLLFVPSEYETWGLVVNEAAAAGLPSIVSDQCGVADDLIVTNETGFVFPVGRTDLVVNWLTALLSQPQGLARLGKEAHLRLKESFTVPQFADKMYCAFTSAV